jgi:hypothetical protein
MFSVWFRGRSGKELRWDGEQNSKLINAQEMMVGKAERKRHLETPRHNL